MAGISVDVYIFPDKLRDPNEQINSFLGYLRDNNVTYNKVWLDV
jgi:hypothetical protein